MQAKVTFRNFEITFSDSDVVNASDFIPAGESNPHNVRPWILHDHGSVLAVVFADSYQDALDIAVDSRKLEVFEIEPEEYPDYKLGEEGVEPDARVSYLGNNGHPYDIESLEVLELGNPAFSFAALVNAQESTVIRIVS